MLQLDAKAAMPCGWAEDETDGSCQLASLLDHGDIAKRQRLMYTILAVAEPRSLNCVYEDVALAIRPQGVWGVRQDFG